MKRKGRKHESYNKKNKKKLHKVKPTLSTKTINKKRWVGQKRTFSPYPYVMMISYYRSNVFFTVADIEGQTKLWTSTGRSGFKKKEKRTYMAIVDVTKLFLKKAWTFGIRDTILIIRNLYRHYTYAAVRYTLRKYRRKYLFNYVGLFIDYETAFNGCRKKKERRK